MGFQPTTLRPIKNCVRDQLLFTTVLSLRCDTSADQVTGGIEAVREKLETSDQVAPSHRVNLIALTQSSLDIEVFSYVIAPDYVSFLNTREALLLFLLETVTSSGSVLAFPPSRLQILPGRERRLRQIECLAPTVANRA